MAQALNLRQLGAVKSKENVRRLDSLAGVAGRDNRGLAGQQGDLFRQTLRGDFLSQQNPYLQQAMDPVRQQYFNTIGQLGSGAVNAGGSGRGVTQNLQGLAQQQLATGLGQIGFQNYNQERQMQQQAAFGQTGIDPFQDQFNNRLQLLSVLQGTQPQQLQGQQQGGSALAGGLGGALAGAGTGAAIASVVPGLGTGLGAVAGGLIGGVGGLFG